MSAKQNKKQDAVPSPETSRAKAAPSHRPASTDAIIVYDFEGEAVKGNNDAGTQVGSKGVKARTPAGFDLDTGLAIWD